MRGNCVSGHNAHIIRNALTASIAYTGKEDEEEEETPKKKDFICSQLPLSVNNVHTIIGDMGQKEREAMLGFGVVVLTQRQPIVRVAER